MITSYHRPTKAIIHLDAIEKNVKQAVEKLGDKKELFAVVKADGYGHGAVEAAHAADVAGAKGFCVATVDEGIHLRNAGFKQTILILGVLEVSAIPLAINYQLSVTIATLDWLLEAEKVLKKQKVTAKKLLVHIKVDTGMGRIGFLEEQEINQAIANIDHSPILHWEGIFTHFATADSVEDSYWQMQNQKFALLLEKLPQLPKYIHTSNSAASLWHNDSVGNMVRYGVAIYGLNPAGCEREPSEELFPAMELVSALVQVKKVIRGTHIGYGAAYIAENDEWIGTVPIGYADGWLRQMQGFSVLVDGNFCEIVGRVCMDQIMIRLPKEYSLSTKVTLIGKNGGEKISMQDVANQLDTIHYEVACTLSDRIPREYKK